MGLLGVFAILILSQLATTITNASTGTTNPPIETQNVRTVISTCWAVYNGSNPHHITEDRLNVYYANGTHITGSGVTQLPIIVVNFGSVAANGCWYEDDGGLSDPNGPTMVQYINITKLPPNTFIYCVYPSGYWECDMTGSVTTTATAKVAINVFNSFSGCITSSVAETYYVYRLEGQTYLPPGANMNYFMEWKWAINQSGPNPVAQTDWIWPTNTIILTPAAEGSNGYYSNAYPIQFVVMTIGHYWETAFPRSEACVGVGCGVGWEVCLPVGSV